LSLSARNQRVTTTLDRVEWSIFALPTDSSAKVQPKSGTPDDDPTAKD
jgi:hypothetical protein